MQNNIFLIIFEIIKALPYFSVIQSEYLSSVITLLTNSCTLKKFHLPTLPLESNKNATSACAGQPNEDKIGGLLKKLEQFKSLCNALTGEIYLVHITLFFQSNNDIEFV